jgi:hypothetical protein
MIVEWSGELGWGVFGTEILGKRETWLVGLGNRRDARTAAWRDSLGWVRGKGLSFGEKHLFCPFKKPLFGGV